MSPKVIRKSYQNLVIKKLFSKIISIEWTEFSKFLIYK